MSEPREIDLLEEKAADAEAIRDEARRAAPTPDTEPPETEWWAIYENGLPHSAYPSKDWAERRADYLMLDNPTLHSLRLTGDAAPTEPENARGIIAGLDDLARQDSHNGFQGETCRKAAAALRAAYAVDGVRAAPTEQVNDVDALPSSHEHGSGVARVAFERQMECGVAPLRAFQYAMGAYAHAYEYNERLPRAAPDAARLIAEAEKILAHRAVASPFRESLREAVEQARLGVQSGDAARLRDFAGKVIRTCLNGGDADGGDVQVWATVAGLLIPTMMAEACDPDTCICAETGDFPQECYRLHPSLAGGSSSQEGDG